MNILIIKPDHIGDYILFRNFIEEIKLLKKYQNSTITCVLNNQIRDLSEFLDQKYIDNFIFINLNKYLEESWYFNKINKQIKLISYDLIINALYNKFTSFEKLIQQINCKKKYSLHQNLTEKNQLYKKENSIHYHKIIDISKNKPFIYEGTKKLFEKIFNTKMLNIIPSIQVKNSSELNFIKEKNYILVFIGADDIFRKWDIYNYANLINYILNSTNYKVILCGGEKELNDSLKIEESVSSKKVINLTAQTSLVDMLFIINNSKLNISNETGIAHMSMALNINTFVISNANHFGKFTPYPKEYSNKYFSIYPFEIKNSSDINKYKKLYYAKSDLNINKISLEKVLIKLNKILNIKIKKSSYNMIDINPNILSPYQLKINYDFSYMFSNLYTDITKLKNKNKKFIIYGKNSFSNVVKTILKDSIIGIIDYKDTSLLNTDISNFYIVIVVLGREDTIEKNLISKYKINPTKIIKFKIQKKSYLKRD
ncbi:glycosyltransferase family 9 protein [Arcobacter sp.]|uniref:glycosyltransferase family 9 protein n=1 Tax=Arcobacter sp. TaxID=1872629 RepID=UPI003C74A03D